MLNSGESSSDTSIFMLPQKRGHICICLICADWLCFECIGLKQVCVWVWSGTKRLNKTVVNDMIMAATSQMWLQQWCYAFLIGGTNFHTFKLVKESLIHQVASTSKAKSTQDARFLIVNEVICIHPFNSPETKASRDVMHCLNEALFLLAFGNS